MQSDFLSSTRFVRIDTDSITLRGTGAFASRKARSTCLRSAVSGNGSSQASLTRSRSPSRRRRSNGRPGLVMRQLREHDLRVPREDLPVGGRREPAVGALEEGEAEGRLDVLQRLAEGRLRQVQPARSFEDAARVIQLGDQLDVTQAELALDPALE